MDRTMLDPTKKKKISQAQGQRRSPSTMVEGVKLHLESSPIPTRDAQRAQTNFVCTRAQRLSQSCVSLSPVEIHVSSGLCRGRGSGCSRPGYGISLLGGGRINPTIELPELTQNWGNRLLEGTNRTLCTPGPRRKEQ